MLQALSNTHSKFRLNLNPFCRYLVFDEGDLGPFYTALYELPGTKRDDDLSVYATPEGIEAVMHLIAEYGGRIAHDVLRQQGFDSPSNPEVFINTIFRYEDHIANIEFDVHYDPVITDHERLDAQQIAAFNTFTLPFFEILKATQAKQASGIAFSCDERLARRAVTIRMKKNEDGSVLINKELDIAVQCEDPALFAKLLGERYPERRHLRELKLSERRLDIKFFYNFTYEA